VLEPVYAIVRDRGRQYKVQEGEYVRVDLLPGEPGTSHTFGEVLLCSDGKKVRTGTPTLTGASVEAIIEENPVKGKKARTFKVFQERNTLRRGHRQKYTLLRVRKIKVGRKK